MKRMIFLLVFANLITSCSEKECEDFAKEHDIQEEFSVSAVSPARDAAERAIKLSYDHIGSNHRSYCRWPCD